MSSLRIESTLKSLKETRIIPKTFIRILFGSATVQGEEYEGSINRNWVYQKEKYTKEKYQNTVIASSLTSGSRFLLVSENEMSRPMLNNTQPHSMISPLPVLTENDRVAGEHIRQEREMLPHVDRLVEHLDHVFLHLWQGLG